MIAVSISLLLKNRFGKACFLQKLVSLMLYSGHANKQVFERLQKLNICVSHYTTIKLVNEIGSGHDSRVCQWRDSLCKGLDILESVDDLPIIGDPLSCHTETFDSSTCSFEMNISEVSSNSVTALQNLILQKMKKRCLDCHYSYLKHQGNHHHSYPEYQSNHHYNYPEYQSNCHYSYPEYQSNRHYSCACTVVPIIHNYIILFV